MAVAPYFKMVDIGYCYDSNLLYWRGMQVDSEILFPNKCPIMVNASDHFQNSLLRGQYLVINVT